MPSPSVCSGQPRGSFVNIPSPRTFAKDVFITWGRLPSLLSGLSCGRRPSPSACTVLAVCPWYPPPPGELDRHKRATSSCQKQLSEQDKEWGPDVDLQH